MMAIILVQNYDAYFFIYGNRYIKPYKRLLGNNRVILGGFSLNQRNEERCKERRPELRLLRKVTHGGGGERGRKGTGRKREIKGS